MDSATSFGSVNHIQFQLKFVGNKVLSNNVGNKDNNCLLSIANVWSTPYSNQAFCWSTQWIYM